MLSLKTYKDVTVSHNIKGQVFREHNTHAQFLTIL